MKNVRTRLAVAAALVCACYVPTTPALAVTPTQEAYCAFWRDYLTLWPFKAYAYRQCIASFSNQ